MEFGNFPKQRRNNCILPFARFPTLRLRKAVKILNILDFTAVITNAPLT